MNKQDTGKQSWKVGELAEHTGLTVRTLHHYDRIGLLSPSQYTEAGHRLYTRADIGRLQQIISLKQLGFALDEIRELMANPGFNPAEVIRIQLERLNGHIRQQEELRAKLESLHGLLNARQDVTAEQLIKIIEVMNMYREKYFTPDQLETLKKRSEALGEEKIRDVQNEWTVLIAKVREQMEKGTKPGDPDAVQLARRWKELMDMFSGGDPAIIKSAEKFHAENPGNELQNGMDGEIYKYMREAISHI